VNRIVGLLFVLRLGDGVVCSLGRGLIRGGFGAVFELRFMRGNHPMIVDLYRSEYGEQEKDYARADDRGFLEPGGNADASGQLQKEERHHQPPIVAATPSPIATPPMMMLNVSAVRTTRITSRLRRA
jgi:hypothetical protein